MPDPTSFLTGYAAHPAAFGAADCCLMLADWCALNKYPDPAASLRGTYDCEAQAAEMIARAGGLLPLVAPYFDGAGLVRALRPMVGDIAVIGSAHAPARQWGALRDASGWRVRHADGTIGRMTAPLLAAWRV